MKDVVIIGAGAAGLMAAYTLARQGKKVVVLEARDRCGGRIHTINQQPHLELGAEFIHGNLPVTLNLLQQAGIKYHHAGGEMWQYKNGKFKTDSDSMPGWDKLMEKLGQLEQDCSMAEFLQREFSGDEYTELRNSVNKYLAGYDTADPARASAMAVKSEWQNEDDDAQYRIDGGYQELIQYLVNEITVAGSEIHLRSPVKKIKWETGKATAITVDGKTHEAGLVLIALPLGVLQADANETGAIQFETPIPEHQNAIQAMGYGAIVKVVLQFNEAFWEDEQTEKLIGKDPKQMGFILSDQEIPTWWTQSPLRSTVLTGWLGGPEAAGKRDAGEDGLLEQSISSLANIFKRDAAELKSKLKSAHIVNWTNDPYTRGSYSYDTMESATSRQLLNKGINNTIFFAGEYLYSGPAMGTVEAALSSGRMRQIKY